MLDTKEIYFSIKHRLYSLVGGLSKMAAQASGSAEGALSALPSRGGGGSWLAGRCLATAAACPLNTLKLKLPFDSQTFKYE